MRRILLRDWFTTSGLKRPGGLTLDARLLFTARILRTARVQLESRALWDFYHCGGIARDVRNATTAGWSEEHVFNCLAWLYNGIALPTE